MTDNTTNSGGDLLSLLGFGLQAYSQIQSGQQENIISQYNAALKQQAAKTSINESQYNSFLEQEFASIAEFQTRKAGARLIGKQKVSYAKSGVVITSGSPLEVMAQTASDIEVDALTTRYGGKLRSRSALYAGQVKAASLLAGANVDAYTGSVMKTNSNMNALTSLINNFSRLT